MKRKMKNVRSLPYLMIFPAMLVTAVFLVYPIIYMCFLSFYKWNMLGEKVFIGWDNYVSLFHNQEFMQVLFNTCKFTVWTVLGFLICGLSMALFLKKRTRLNNLIQTIVFTPYVLPLISVAYVWIWLMDSDVGLLNYILNLLGIDSVRWLTDPKMAMNSLILVNIWKGSGYYALLFLSALKNISPDFYEAAELDNSGPVRTFIHITLPMISPTTFFLSLTAIINAFKVFETVNVMTGGSSNTTTLVYYVYQYGFQYYKIGYASAVGVILLIIVSILTILYFACLQKKVYYH